MLSHLFALVIPWALISLSGVMAPGPISAMAVSAGAQQGFIAGPLISVGHAATEALLVAALAVGLGQVLQQPTVAGVIGVLGGVVLLWMGWDLTRSVWQAPAAFDASRPEQGTSVVRSGLISAGVLLSVSNPYWLLWWATVGSATMLRFLEFGLLGVLVFYVSHISLDFGWNTFLSTVSRSGREVIGDRVFRFVLLVCGVALLAFGVYFIVTGVSMLKR